MEKFTYLLFTNHFQLIYLSSCTLTNQQIRSCQRGDEVVTGLPDGPVDQEGQQYQHVTADRQQDNHHQEGGEDRSQPQRKRRQDGLLVAKTAESNTHIPRRIMLCIMLCNL